MKAIMLSIKRPYTDYINNGLKISELRTRVPNIKPPFKVYTYETSSTGCGKVVNEWVCNNITEWRMCVGVPVHLMTRGHISVDDIWKYCNKGRKNIFEMEISNLKIFDKPKELEEFSYPIPNNKCEKHEKGLPCDKCDTFNKEHNVCMACYYMFRPVKRPPQSWCYVEEL